MLLSKSKFHNLFKIFFLISMLGFFAIPLVGLAQGYVPLAPIDGYTDTNSAAGGLSGYLNTMFKFGVALASGLAVIMIVIGGIQYMSSDAVSNKSEGINRMTSAIWGLILALGAYVILNTINPALLKTNLQITPVSVGGAAQTGGGTLVPAGQYGPGGTVGTTGGGNGIADEYDSNGIHYIDYNDGSTAVINPDGSNYLLDSNDNYIEGYTINSDNVAIDTDGRTDPGLDPTTHKSCTSYVPNNSCLDATTDNYVAVPTGSGIPMGTPVLITDSKTGKTAWAVVGDAGATGYGEISLHAAQTLGLAVPGKNAVYDGSNLSFTFYNSKH